MKVSDTINAVNQWFKLSNYDVLQEITVDGLRCEVSRRLSLQRHDFSKEEQSRHERYLVIRGGLQINDQTKFDKPTPLNYYDYSNTRSMAQFTEKSAGFFFTNCQPKVMIQSNDLYNI